MPTSSTSDRARCLHRTNERVAATASLAVTKAPTPGRQRLVSVVGMGGMGKTQLSLAHGQSCADDYSSVFWVNAKDESSLRRSIMEVGAVIFQEFVTAAAQGPDDEKLKVDKVRRWLSEPENDEWLMIFDNYDDPLLPGMKKSTGYDIRTYFPYRAQGSILITTRSPQLSFTKQHCLKKFDDIEQSLAIMVAASGRSVAKGETEICHKKWPYANSLA